VAFPAEAIMRAMVAVVQGEQGGRRVAHGTFTHADLYGETPENARTKVKGHDGHLFDLRLLSFQNDSSTPVASIGSRRHIRIVFELDIWSQKNCDISALDRIAFVASVMSDADDAVQALNHEDALAQDIAGNETNAVGGMVMGSGATEGTPSWDRVDEDWVNHIVRSRVQGALVVVVEQNEPG
jgi:hypothetical protein